MRHARPWEIELRAALLTLFLTASQTAFTFEAPANANTKRSFTEADSAVPVSSSESDIRLVSSGEKYLGLGLAILSSFLIGSSFILTKMGLNDAAANASPSSRDESGRSATRRVGAGYAYLKNARWWAGLTTMIAGETANFAAYSFAPAILVTPLGALSVLISSVLAVIFLGEEMKREGVIGCGLCLVGSVIVVMHAPQERAVSSVNELLEMALNPFFVIYVLLAVGISLFTIFKVSPIYGRRNILVYIIICSLLGSLSVMSVKGFGIALKLTIEGSNQFFFPTTYLFLIAVVLTALTQINYFNKSLGLFSTNLVTPIYYVLFTTSTVVASLALMAGGGMQSSVTDIISSFCGFVVIFIGVFMLNMTPGATRKPSGIGVGEALAKLARVRENAGSNFDEPTADGYENLAATRMVSTGNFSNDVTSPFLRSESQLPIKNDRNDGNGTAGSHLSGRQRDKIRGSPEKSFSTGRSSLKSSSSPNSQTQNVSFFTDTDDDFHA